MGFYLRDEMMKALYLLFLVVFSQHASALDYLKPIYTKEGAVVCPYGLALDVRLEHKKLLGLFKNSDEAKQKASHIGCTRFPADARMYTYDIGKGLIAISPTETNYYQFITISSYLKNDDYLDNYYAEQARRSEAIRLGAEAYRLEQEKKIEELRKKEVEEDLKKREQELIAEQSFINCNDSGVCVDAPNDTAKRMIERQWQETPPSVREKCLKKKRFQQAQDCLMSESVEYMASHPQEFPKWIIIHPEDGWIAPPKQ